MKVAHEPARLAWLAIAVVGVSTLVFARSTTVRRHRCRSGAGLEDFACPVCRGQSVAESDVVVAGISVVRSGSGSMRSVR